MQIDTKTMSPWHDISRILGNAKSLVVMIGDDVHAGLAELEIDGQGVVTLAFDEAPKPKRRALRVVGD